MTYHVRSTAVSAIRKGHTIVCPADGEHEVVTGKRTAKFGGFARIDTPRHEHFRDLNERLGRVVRGENPDD